MALEIKEDNSAYVFSYTKYVNDQPSTITTATISIVNSAGTEYMASNSMTIATSTATETIDFSTDPTGLTWSVGRNYIAKMVIDGVAVNRYFDIVRYPFTNEVTIVELENENRQALDKAGYKYRGESETGSTNVTVIDSRLIGEETYIGGEIELLPLDNSENTETRAVTNFNSTNGTITFSPSITASTYVGRDYILRRSFAEDIDRAGEIVKNDLWKKEMRAYLVLDNSQLNNMIVYKFFERMFDKRRTSFNEDDRDHVQFMSYKDKYDSEFAGLPLAYDSDDSGAVDDSESAYKDSVRFIR